MLIMLSDITVDVFDDLDVAGRQARFEVVARQRLLYVLVVVDEVVDGVERESLSDVGVVVVVGVLILFRLLLIPVHAEVFTQVERVDEAQRLLQAAVMVMCVVVVRVIMAVIEQILVFHIQHVQILLFVFDVVQMFAVVEGVEVEAVVGVADRTRLVIVHCEFTIAWRYTQYCSHCRFLKRLLGLIAQIIIISQLTFMVLPLYTNRTAERNKEISAVSHFDVTHH